MSDRTQAALLDDLQRETFGYFLHESNPTNGLVTDKTAPHWPASIAAVGLALAALPGRRRARPDPARETPSRAR